MFNKLIRDAASLLRQSLYAPSYVLGSDIPSQVAHVFLEDLMANQPVITQLGRAREYFMQFGECDIRWLLSVWRDLKSTHERDKVYAAMGIARSRYRIVPDYTASSTMTKLLVNVVKRSALVDGKLDIILDGGEPNRHTDWNLPSWIPDFTVSTSKKYPAHAPQSHDPRFNNSTSQAGPSPNAEYVFRAMKDLPAEFQFLSKHTTLLNHPPPLSETEVPLLLRIKLLRHWSLREDELGIVGNLPRSQSVQDSWINLTAKKSKAHAPAMKDDPGSARYPHTDGEDLAAAYYQTVHFYPDLHAVLSAMDYEQKPSNPMSMTQLQLGVRQDAERVLMKGREAQQSGNWRFFCTNNLVMGMVPADTQAGDWVCFASGISVPFVVRPYRGPGAYEEDDERWRMEADKKPSSYTVVGAAYVHGYMFGLAAEQLTWGFIKTEWVDLY